MKNMRKVGNYHLDIAVSIRVPKKAKMEMSNPDQKSSLGSRAQAHQSDALCFDTEDDALRYFTKIAEDCERMFVRERCVLAERNLSQKINLDVDVLGNGLTIIRPNETALVASNDGSMEIFMPRDERELSRIELLLAAVAIKMKDESWVDETIQALAEPHIEGMTL